MISSFAMLYTKAEAPYDKPIFAPTIASRDSEDLAIKGTYLKSTICPTTDPFIGWGFPFGPYLYPFLIRTQYLNILLEPLSCTIVLEGRSTALTLAGTPIINPQKNVVHTCLACTI